VFAPTQEAQAGIPSGVSWPTVIALPIVFFLGFSAIVLLLFALFSPNEPKYFHIPQGFTGPVLIVYDQPDGQAPGHEGAVQIFEIPADGVLLTQSPRIESEDDDFW
jgi:hypothetical protein